MLKKIKERSRTSRMIRNAIDTYPDGICFAASGGRPIMVNKKINDICYRLTGYTITNTERMWRELEQCAIQKKEDTILCQLKDKTIWQFQRKRLSKDNLQITQYEASDITELYEYQNRLAENNLQVSQLHDRQRELLKKIVQSNLDQELLSAKMRIHDRFGRLLLMTKHALSEDAQTNCQDLISAWENIIADMENAAIVTDSVPVSPQNELLEVAGLIGCRVEFYGKQPTQRKALLLLYAAIREGLTNAVRHAGADKLIIIITENDNGYAVRILHNGRSSDCPIREGGGLTNLRRRLEREGATLDYRYEKGVELVLTIPKE